MLEEILKQLKEKDFSQTEINHALAIILRAWDELEYMKNKDKFQNFELNQHNNFSIMFKDNKLYGKIIGQIFEIKDIDTLSKKIYNYFSNKYPINYDYKLIDPIYFSLFFYDLLDKIVNIKNDEINIKDFRLLRKYSEPVTMEDSESYKALIKGEIKKIYTPFKSNHIIDTDEERLITTLKSIKQHGYPFKNKYVILYNDEPYIRDGQHRVAILKYLYGDINIKVLRIYLENNYFYD